MLGVDEDCDPPTQAQKAWIHTNSWQQIYTLANREHNSSLMCWQKAADDNTMHYVHMNSWHCQACAPFPWQIKSQVHNPKGVLLCIHGTVSGKWMAGQQMQNTLSCTPPQCLANCHACVPLRVVAELSCMRTATCGGRIVMHAYRYVWWQAPSWFQRWWDTWRNLAPQHPPSAQAQSEAAASAPPCAYDPCPWDQAYTKKSHLSLGSRIHWKVDIWAYACDPCPCTLNSHHCYSTTLVTSTWAYAYDPCPWNQAYTEKLHLSLGLGIQWTLTSVTVQYW